MNAEDFDAESRRENHEVAKTAQTLEQEIDDLSETVERQAAELELLRAEHDAARGVAIPLTPKRAALDPAFVVWLDAWNVTETAR